MRENKLCAACGEEIVGEQMCAYPGPKLLAAEHPGRWEGLIHESCMTPENVAYLRLTAPTWKPLRLVGQHD